MSIQFILKKSYIVLFLGIISGGLAMASSPPVSTGENIALVRQSVSTLRAVAEDMKSLVNKIDSLKRDCSLPSEGHLKNRTTFESKLISCSREYRSYLQSTRDIELKIIAERISLNSGKFANFPIYQSKAIGTIDKLLGENEKLENKLNEISDRFIERYGKSKEQGVKSGLDAAALKGAYEGLCSSLHMHEKSDSKLLPIQIGRAKNFADAFLVHEEIIGKIKIRKIFQNKCDEPLSEATYGNLLKLAKDNLKKYSASAWVTEQCRKIKPNQNAYELCSASLQLNSYTVNYLKSGGALEK